MAGPDKHVLIIGGGTAGITVAATLVRRAGASRPDITIVEPSAVHYYQPAFTLVGAGAFRFESTRRDEETLIPPGVESMAAFPLRRGGEVVGALSLLAGEPDFFDPQVQGLLDEMAGDLSFALEHLRRERHQARELDALRDALRQREPGLVETTPAAESPDATDQSEHGPR